MKTADEIKADIDRLFGNTSVPVSDTRADLKDIREHCNMLLETLDDGEDE